MKFLNLLVLSCFLFTNVFAAGVPLKPQTDVFQLGKDGSTADKQIIINTGDGVSNPKIEVDNTTKRFEINKGVDVTGSMTTTGAISATGAISGQGLTTVNGATVGGDLTVTGGDINLGAGTNKLRANAGFLEFSNDGTLYKKIGSGSGGDSGVSIIENSSFEDGLTPGWTSSGGTFSQQSYTNSVENDLKYARFVSTIAGEYFETSTKAIPDFGTGGCLAKINYQTLNSASWKIQVYDSVANLLGEQALGVKEWQNGYVSFPCPAAGTLVKMRIISLAAGTINADKGYLGLENRTFQAGQAKLIGTLNIATCSTNYTANTTSLTTMGTNTSCTYTATGSVLAPTTMVAGFRLPRISKGNLKVIARGGFGKGATTTNADIIFAVKDITNTVDGQVNQFSFSAGAGAAVVTPEIGGLLTYNSDKTAISSFEIYGASSISTSGTSAAIYMTGLTSGTSRNLFFEVWHFPDDSTTAVVPESQDWFIDANIGGAAVTLGTVAVSSYTEAVNASLDLVLNTGSASAKIPCSATNAATGLTCSAGSEGVGVVFTNPQPGYYEACTYFAHTVSVGSASALGTTFEIVETTNSAQTILQEGKARMTSGYNNGSSLLMGSTSPHANCGSFYFSSVSERTIRVMYEQSISGVNVAASQIDADRSASQGQRDIRIIVRPLLSPYNRPYLADNNKYGKVNQSSGQVLVNATPAKVTWSASPNFIRGITFDSTNNRFVAQASGIYKACSKITTIAAIWSADQGIDITLYKNGVAEELLGFDKKDTSTITTTMSVNGCALVSLAVGDYVEIFGNTTRPANIQLSPNGLNNTFSITKEGDI